MTRDLDKIRAIVRSIFGSRADVSLSMYNGADAAIELTPDTTWTYDNLKQLAEAIGTTDLRFRWDTDPGYSELTPGGPDTVTIDVRWPNPSTPPAPTATVKR